MRLENADHLSQPWRIHELVRDFRLEDVWALPVRGGARDFAAVLTVVGSLDPGSMPSAATRLLFETRHLLGAWLGWDDAGDLPIPGRAETSLGARLPDDLRGTAAGLRFGSAALDNLGAHFVPLYRTDFEFAAEVSNQTVHGVVHLSWVNEGDGAYQGQMAVYVKPRGRLGNGYMAVIKPFRYWIVYPALMRQVERAWNARPQATRRRQAHAGLHARA